MAIQEVLIGLIFIGSGIYLARLVYRQFTKGNCASGCGKCQTIDFKKVEKQVSERFKS